MRRILVSFAMLTVLVAPAARASHEAAGCLGATEVLLNATCPVTISCPDGADGCFWRLDVSAGGAGLVSIALRTGDVVWASCGQAPLGCAGVGVFNLPPGSLAILTCAVDGPALLAEYACSATPTGHF